MDYQILFKRLCYIFYLSGHGRFLNTLGEMRAHEPLEIEIGELVVLLELEKLAELGVGENNAPVCRILQLVGANVSVDLLCNLSAGHLGSVRLSEE